MRRIAKATGASIVTTLADMEGNETFDPEVLGDAEEVSRAIMSFSLAGTNSGSVHSHAGGAQFSGDDWNDHDNYGTDSAKESNALAPCRVGRDGSIERSSV